MYFCSEASRLRAMLYLFIYKEKKIMKCKCDILRLVFETKGQLDVHMSSVGTSSNAPGEYPTVRLREIPCTQCLRFSCHSYIDIASLSL